VGLFLLSEGLWGCVGGGVGFRGSLFLPPFLAKRERTGFVFRSGSRPCVNAFSGKLDLPDPNVYMYGEVSL
jgi:hypothetical protein